MFNGIHETVSNKQNMALHEVISCFSDWEARSIALCRNYFSSNLCTMANKAKSQELKNQIFRKEVDDLKAYAANIYIAESIT